MFECLQEQINTSSVLIHRLTLKTITGRFPKLFDHRLQKGLERMIANCPEDFLTKRSSSHLQTLLLVQFFLQKKIESALNEQHAQKHLFLKLFLRPGTICVALAIPTSYGFQREQLLKSFQILLPGILEVPDSFFLWHHPKLPYLFCYLEVHKLRGEELSKIELKEMEKALGEQLRAIPPLTPALFWPYNEEESFRQIGILQRELKTKKDLPQVSVHFQEQTLSYLKFLIHIVRPKSSELLDQELKRLPDALQPFCYFHYARNSPFPLELGAFSLKVPSSAFDVGGSINLLYARRFCLKYLETIIGPFRDFNGGLFEKQQQHFAMIRLNLERKIPHFSLFAEKLFYALHPVELRFSIPLDQAEELFMAVSNALLGKDTSCSENILISKTTDPSKVQDWSRIDRSVAHAQFTFGSFHYLCLIGPGIAKFHSTFKKPSLIQEKTKTLHLIFQEGAPLSLNPHHSSADMRSRLLSKLLFEGLMRLNAEGKPELAGASNYSSSEDGLVYTFTLRPYSWTNGESITATDYVTSWQCALRDHMSHPELLFVVKNAQAFKEKKCGVKELGLKAIDAETLQIELENADPNFLYKLTKPFFFPVFGSLREPKWFNGPFLVRELTENGLILESNPYFWNTKDIFFKQIYIRWSDDIEDIYTLFQEGAVDWIGDPLNTFSLPSIHQLEKKERLKKQPINRELILYFNTKHPILSSPLIRRALSLSIDRSFICDTILPYNIPSIPTASIKEESLFLFEKGITELGWTRENLPALTFTYFTQVMRDQLAEYLQSTWQKTLGITIKLEKNSWNLFRNRMEKGDFQIGIMIDNKKPNDNVLEFLGRLEGSSSWNFSRWTHPFYRETINNALLETNEKNREALEKYAEKILEEETPFTSLLSRTYVYAHRSALTGYLIDQEGCVDLSYASFIHKEK